MTWETPCGPNLDRWCIYMDEKCFVCYTKTFEMLVHRNTLKPSSGIGYSWVIKDEYKTGIVTMLLCFRSGSCCMGERERSENDEEIERMLTPP